MATYYELYDVQFECDLEGLGHVKLMSKTGKFDILMKHLRLTGPVEIAFTSGMAQQAKHVDLNLVTGHIKPVGVMMKLQGRDVPIGVSRWQIN